MKYLIPLLLCACTTGPVKDPLADVVLVAPKQTVVVPDYLLQPCLAVQPLEVKDYNQVETLTVSRNALALYDVCRSKDMLLIEAIKKAFKVEGSK